MEQSINLFLDNNSLTSQNSLSHLLDFDSDFNELTNSIKPSMYYTEGDFIKKLDNKSCIIMSLNCQSLQAQFSQIKMLVDTFAENDTPIQVLCLQETWLENSDLIDLGIYQIQDYHFVTQNRYASAHGGLAFYIPHNWNYKIKSNEIDSLYWEELLLKSPIMLIQNLSLILQISTDHPIQPFPNLHHLLNTSLKNYHL